MLNACQSPQSFLPFPTTAATVHWVTILSAICRRIQNFSERAYPLHTAIDFADASVRRAAVIEAANGQRVQEASASGDADSYRKWFPIWQQSANLLRQLTKEDREARKSSGTLLSRSAVIAELSQLVEALRIMMESMPAKILAELQRSSSKRIRRVTRLLAEPLKEATQRARESESAVFQNLECLSSPETAQETLKLKAA